MKNPKLIDIILFSLFVVLSVIALYESIYRGIAQSYWLFMLAFATLIIYNVRKMKRQKSAGTSKTEPSSRSSKRHRRS